MIRLSNEILIPVMTLFAIRILLNDYFLVILFLNCSNVNIFYLYLNGKKTTNKFTRWIVGLWLPHFTSKPIWCCKNVCLTNSSGMKAPLWMDVWWEWAITVYSISVCSIEQNVSERDTYKYFIDVYFMCV